MYTLSPVTLIESAKLNQNFTDLSTGDADTIANSLKTFRDEAFFDFVLSGGVWSADSAGVNRNASMSAMVIVINGRRIPINAVTARTFTASKDTYVDVLDNADGTGTLVYTEVTNNAASPALASNSVRVAIVVTGASTIAAAASINQGQEDRVLPIASSIAYSVTDSLGNLICPRDPNRRVLGYRQQLTTFTTASTTPVDVTGISAAVIVPTGRKIRISVFYRFCTSTGTNMNMVAAINESSTVLGTSLTRHTSAGDTHTAYPQYVGTPSAGLHTYKLQFNGDAAGTHSLDTGSSTNPIFMLVELI